MSVVPLADMHAFFTVLEGAGEVRGGTALHRNHPSVHTPFFCTLAVPGLGGGGGVVALLKAYSRGVLQKLHSSEITLPLPAALSNFFGM